MAAKEHYGMRWFIVEARANDEYAYRARVLAKTESTAKKALRHWLGHPVEVDWIDGLWRV